MSDVAADKLIDRMCHLLSDANLPDHAEPSQVDVSGVTVPHRILIIGDMVSHASVLREVFRHHNMPLVIITDANEAGSLKQIDELPFYPSIAHEFAMAINNGCFVGAAFGKSKPAPYYRQFQKGWNK